MSGDSRTDDFGADDFGTDEPRTSDSPTEETDEARWRERGIGLLLVAGIVLFVVPEPATTVLGAVLIIAGVAGWLTNRFG